MSSTERSHILLLDFPKDAVIALNDLTQEEQELVLVDELRSPWFLAIGYCDLGDHVLGAIERIRQVLQQYQIHEKDVELIHTLDDTTLLVVLRSPP